MKTIKLFIFGHFVILRIPILNEPIVLNTSKVMIKECHIVIVEYFSSLGDTLQFSEITTIYALTHNLKF